MSASYPTIPHPDGKNFHSASVSIPISIPSSSRPGEKITGNIPFGPPVLHEEPEKTHALFHHPLYTDNQTQVNTNYPNFFRIDGPCIVQPEFFDQYEEDDNMELEE